MNMKPLLCKFTWRPRLVTIFLSSGLVLSTTSSLYCDFFKVALGFIPKGYDNDVLGVALWSFEAADGKCQSFKEAYILGGFSTGDDNYSRLIINGDIAWTIARFAALVGSFFGTVGLVCSLINVCRDGPILVDVLAYTAIVGLISEASKLGLFFTTELCVSEDFWYSYEIDEYMGATSCTLSQGAYVCIGSIAVYFISSVFLVAYNSWPMIDDHDDSSLQEMVFGEKTSTTQATSFLTEQSQKTHSPPWTETQADFQNELVSENESNESDDFDRMDSGVESFHRRESEMSSQVEPYSATSYTDFRRRSSVETSYSDRGEEAYDDTVMHALPQFNGPKKHTARRLMDDVSAITMDASF